MKYAIFPSPIGELVLVGDPFGISQLMINNQTKLITIDKDWQRDQAFFDEAKVQLAAYFSGERKTFDLALNPNGTDFQCSAWRALCAIPFGEVRSYGQVASELGNPKASRAVGLANNRNPIPILIPCHRVIGTNGDLTGYAYGLDVKRWLLDLECADR